MAGRTIRKPMSLTLLRAAGPAAALLSLAACTPSLWASRRLIREGTIEGRLYVPKLYGPLLPGSIYPNRQVEIPPRGCPFVIVSCPAAGSCPVETATRTLGERKLIAFVLKRSSTAGRRRIAEVDAAAGWLERRPETEGAPWAIMLPGEDGETTGDLLRSVNDGGKGRGPIALAVFVSPGTKVNITASASPASGAAAADRAPPGVLPSRKDLQAPTPRFWFAFLARDGRPGGSSVPGAEAERWYQPAEGRNAFPPEAFKDATQWLAYALGVR